MKETKKVSVQQNALFNSGAPPRSAFESSVSRIGNKPIVFDGKALLESIGLKLTEQIKKKSIFSIKFPGIPSFEEVETRVKELPKFILSPLPDKKVENSTDIVLAIGVLSRRSGKFFMRGRVPDNTIGFLVSDKFIIENTKHEK